MDSHLFCNCHSFDLSEFINNPYLIEADRARGIDDPLGADIPLSMGLPFLIIYFVGL